MSRRLLVRELERVSGAISTPPCEVSGPRRWWKGPLDVEGLAIESVQSFATLAAELTGEKRVRSSADLVFGAFQSLGLLRINGVADVGFAPMSGFFATADGWIRVHANYPHHAAVLERVWGAGNAAALQDALRNLSAVAAEERIVTAGGVAAAVRTVASWRAQLSGHSSFVSCDETHRAPGAIRLPGPLLGGLRVLDLTRVVAGPVASRALALLGADVLRVDPVTPAELLDHYVDTGFNKRSVRMDLASAPGLDAVHGLLRDANVLMLSYRPGALDKFGLSAEALATRHPHLHQVRIQAWPLESAWGDRRGFDSIVQAATGISDLYRRPDGTPGALPVQALDHATGYAAAAAALASLLRHERTGEVGSVTLTLADTAARLIDSPASELPPTLPTPTIAYALESRRQLRFAAPPLLIADARIDYAHAPGPYGGDQPRWRRRGND